MEQRNDVVRAAWRSDAAALILRVSAGAMFVAHGILLKLIEFTPAGTAEYFASIGYPAVLAYVVIAAETVGGLMLILGLWTRWVALGLIPILIGATLEHLEVGWLFSNAGGGYQFPAFWAVVMFAQFLLGDGHLSAMPFAKRLSSRAHRSHIEGRLAA